MIDFQNAGDFVKDTADSAVQFTKENPLVAIAGVAAVGLAIGAATKPGRSAGRKAGRLIREHTGKIAGDAVGAGIAFATSVLGEVFDELKAKRR